MTPLQWAVLTAYARSLPPGDERQRVQTLTDGAQPVRCGPAQLLAQSLGFTDRRGITAQGTAAARQYLAAPGQRGAL